MQLKMTEIEQENKKREIKKWQTIRISQNGGHRSQGDSISFLSMADVPHHCSKFILRKTMKEYVTPQS